MIASRNDNENNFPVFWFFRIFYKQSDDNFASTHLRCKEAGIHGFDKKMKGEYLETTERRNISSVE